MLTTNLKTYVLASDGKIYETKKINNLLFGFKETVGFWVLDKNKIPIFVKLIDTNDTTTKWRTND